MGIFRICKSVFCGCLQRAMITTFVFARFNYGLIALLNYCSSRDEREG